MAVNGKKKNITKVNANTAIIPSYMENVEDHGLEGIAQYIIPPFIKMVQRQSDSEILDEFGEGDVIITPDNLLLSQMKVDEKHRPTGETDGFLITPILFYPEFIAWNPIELKGSLPSIRERSLDPMSEIAVKSKSSDLRFEPIEPDSKNMIKYVEHLNFVLIVHNCEFTEPCILSFSRGEHKAGRAFCNVIKMRNAPIYGGIYQAHQSKRSNNFGEWWGLDIHNPSIDVSSPWNTEETFEAFKALHLSYKKHFADAKLRADYVEPTETAEATEY